MKQVTFLGHVISKEGVSIDFSKTTAMVERPRSTNALEIRSFLGLAGYYRRFVQNFSSIAAPLTRLAKKAEKFVWCAECKSCFQELKTKLTSTPVLAVSSGNGGFIVYSDA